MKFAEHSVNFRLHSVALFTRAWIEIKKSNTEIAKEVVALFTRAWIEICGTIALV